MPDFHDTEIKKLQNLGLTEAQSKIYLALVSIGKGTVLSISRIVNIDRSNVYRIILQLQDIGLLVRLVDSPNQYQAVPAEQAVQILMNLKRVEYNRAQRIAKELSRKKISVSLLPSPSENEFFIENVGREKHVKRIVDALENAQETIDSILNIDSFVRGMLDLSEYQLSCIKRGVKQRVITSKIPDSSGLQRVLKSFLAEKNFELRVTSESLTYVAIIIDNKTLSLFLIQDSAVGMKKNKILSAHHPGIINVFQSYFNKIWDQSQRYQTPCTLK